jgi:hypothetical protein
MRASIALALLALSPAFAEDAAKTWTLKFDSKPAVGMMTDETMEESTNMAMKISSGGKVVREEASEKSSSFEFRCEITAVSDNHRTGIKWTFKKAKRVEGGVESACGFEGKTVIGTRGEDKKWTFAYEDGAAVADADLASLRTATDTKQKDKDEPSGQEMFAPKAPVKEGESWTPDMELIGKSFGSDSLSVDQEASKGTCTLKKVETRNGVEFGLVTFDLSLEMDFKAPLTLEKSIPFTTQGEINACLDGSGPDGTMKMTFVAEGKRAGSVAQKKGQPVAIELDMLSKGTMTRTRTSVKP